MLGELSRRDELHPFFIIESKNTLLGMRILRRFKNPSIHLLKVFPSRWIFLIIAVK